MKNILMLISAIIFCGCVVEHGGKYTSYIENATPYSVHIQHYKSGIEDLNFKLNISSNSTSEVLVIAGSDGLYSYADKVSIFEFDSITISYNDSKMSIHYGYNIQGHNPNAVLYSNLRNIFNVNNWDEKIIEEKRKKSVKEFYYRITEQDYKNAQ